MTGRPPARWLDLGLAQIESRAWYEWHWERGLTPGSRRTKIPAWLRRAVMQRDGLTCGICAESVEPDDVQLDHIIPVSLGGENRLENLRVTHSLCNARKGARVN